MNAFRSNCGPLLLGAALSVLVPATAFGLERGLTPDGVKYVSGGIGESEQRSMHAERKRYSLWVSTVAKGSGAYLAGAHLRIAGLDGNPLVLDHSMDGPWFFTALPPGHYEVTASLLPTGANATETIKSTVRIRAGEHRQVVMRFTSSADVGSERHRVFDGNPFSDG